MARKQVKAKDDISASDGDRNIDVFFRENRAGTKIEYFYHSRRNLEKGSINPKKPEYILVEIRRYVLGVIYLWELKN